MSEPVALLIAAKPTPRKVPNKTPERVIVVGMPKPDPDPFEEIREAARKKKNTAEFKLISVGLLTIFAFVLLLMFDFSGYIRGEFAEWVDLVRFTVLVFATTILVTQNGSATADRIVYNTVTYATRHTSADSRKIIVMRQLVGLEPVEDKRCVSTLLNELTRPEPEKYESLD